MDTIIENLIITRLYFKLELKAMEAVLSIRLEDGNIVMIVITDTSLKVLRVITYQVSLRLP